MSLADVQAIRSLLLHDDQADPNRYLAPLFPGALWSTAATIGIYEHLDDHKVGEAPLFTFVYATQYPLSNSESLTIITAGNPDGTMPGNWHKMAITREDQDHLCFAITPHGTSDTRIVHIKCEE